MFQSFDVKGGRDVGRRNLPKLRRAIAAAGLDGFLVPHEDEYQNEYLPEANERLAWATGFTGSAGAALVLADRAILFVDGRYTLQAAAQTDPGLIEVRDGRGRSWLHVCCSVNAQARGLRPGDAVRTADALLRAGLDVNEAAFSEGSWRATPLWYAVARGQNLTLARHLLARGSDPNHCLWAAAFRDDLPAIELLVQPARSNPPSDSVPSNVSARFVLVIVPVGTAFLRTVLVSSIALAPSTARTT